MKIGVIGFGRFGQLIAKHLKKFGPVLVYNRSNKKRQAKALGCEWVNLKEVCQADLVILAVPISELEKVIKKIKKLVKPGIIVMDVASVKSKPCRWLKKHLPRRVEVLGTHPVFGPDSTKNGLDNLNIVVCPIRIKKKNLDKISNIFKKLKLDIIKTTPERHDQEIALSLGLVHFLGRGLEKVQIRPLEISSVGYERLLGVCDTVSNDSWQLFSDMQEFNPYASGIRKRYLKALQEINHNITNRETEKQRN